MKFYTKQHNFYCGIDLYARCFYVCILNQAGEIVLHKNIKANPQALIDTIEPYRDNLVIGVECMFTWFWVVDLCEQEKIKLTAIMDTHRLN
jgi:hypothetical protein